jgi:hypothetical protein
MAASLSQDQQQSILTLIKADVTMIEPDKALMIS